MKMPAAMRDKWVAALRSGKYTQDYGLLRTNKGYCCLGVLQEEVSGDVERCEIAPTSRAIDVPSYQWWTNVGVKVDTRLDYEGIPKVCDSQLDLLTCMNDGDISEEDDDQFTGDKSFNQIADWIEENVETF